jgi:hypothetical protein
MLFLQTDSKLHHHQKDFTRVLDLEPVSLATINQPLNSISTGNNSNAFLFNLQLWIKIL